VRKCIYWSTFNHFKGSTIGRNSIGGAGSVATRNIPNNDIWPGDAAKIVRKI